VGKSGEKRKKGRKRSDGGKGKVSGERERERSEKEKWEKDANDESGENVKNPLRQNFFYFCIYQ
jgi:hypothetical protein